jgi:hypothetical protein
MIEDFIANLPDHEKKIVHRLRNIILETAPMLREKLSYGVPYYFLKKRICFIWPASAPLSGKTDGVALGFCEGYLMANEEGLLLAEGRKQVLMIHYTSVSQINPGLVRQWVHEAILISEQNTELRS